MARPLKTKVVRGTPAACCYRPQGVPAESLIEIVLSMEELEALRLVDYEGFYQQDAANQMEISRPTMQRMVCEARAKVVGALLNGSALRIEGGNYILREDVDTFRCGRCGKQFPRQECRRVRSCRCPACRRHQHEGCPQDGAHEHRKEEQ